MGDYYERMQLWNSIEHPGGNWIKLNCAPTVQVYMFSSSSILLKSRTSTCYFTVLFQALSATQNSYSFESDLSTVPILIISIYTNVLSSFQLRAHCKLFNYTVWIMFLQGGQSPFVLAGMPMGTSIRPQMQYLKALESSGCNLVSHYSEVLFNVSQFFVVYKPVLFVHLQV